MCSSASGVSEGTIGVNSGNGEGLEGLGHIPIGRVCEPLQRLQPLSGSCLLQPESTLVPTALERFKLPFPAVEMLADSGDLSGELVVPSKFSPQPVTALPGCQGFRDSVKRSRLGCHTGSSVWGRVKGVLGSRWQRSGCQGVQGRF